jgi:hypothetical protein
MHGTYSVKPLTPLKSGCKNKIRNSVNPDTQGTQQKKNHTKPLRVKANYRKKSNK